MDHKGHDLKIENYAMGVSLGEGAFGNVKVAWPKKDKSKKYAMKCMKKKDIIDSKHVDHIHNEKVILE